MLDFLGKMKDIQSKMEETKNKLEATKIVGINRDASVRVTVNGARRVLQIDVDDTFYQQNNKETVLNSIKEAMQDATNKSEEIIREEMKGAMPSIPGLNFE